MHGQTRPACALHTSKQRFGYSPLGGQGKAFPVVENEDVRRICAEEYMRHVSRTCRRMELEFERFEAEKARLDVLGVNYESVKAGPAAKDSLPNGVIAFIGMVDSMEADLSEYAETVSEADAAINSLEDPDEAAALHYRYIVGAPWADVSRMLGYSERTTYRIKSAALAALYPLMPEEWRRMLPKAV